MRYPRSVQLGMGGGARQSAPMPKDEPPTFPRRAPDRRKPGRKVTSHPRRPQGPQTRPAPGRRGPSAPQTPPPSDGFPDITDDIRRFARGMIRGYMSNLYGGVFQSAYETLQVFRTSDMILENGWTKGSVCRLDFNGYAKGSTYCGGQTANRTGPTVEIGTVGLNSTRYTQKAFLLNAFPTAPTNKDAYSFTLSIQKPNFDRSKAPYTAAQAEALFGARVPQTRHLQAAQPSWEIGVFPGLIPILAPGLTPRAWPLNRPRIEGVFTGRQVGPAPAPKPATANPLKPGTTTVLQPGVKPVTRPNTAGLPRPPGKRTKEVKARMTPAMAAIWHGIGTLTEVGDFATVLYENLPKRRLVEFYRKNGRQPNPAEKLGWVFMHLNEINLGGAFHDYIANEIEDRLYALGGKKMGEANRLNNRPIGYEAGGSLTGGGEYIPTQTTLRPDWWPSVLPW